MLSGHLVAQREGAIMKLKLNPYSVLLTTGVLMLATVVLAQMGTGANLLKQGARSVDKDISSFAAKALKPSDPAATVDSGPVAGELDNTSAQVAAAETVADRTDGDSHRERVVRR
jgi:hypothetical protein